MKLVTINGMSALMDSNTRQVALLPDTPYEFIQVLGKGIVGAVDRKTGSEVKLFWRGILPGDVVGIKQELHGTGLGERRF